MSFIEARLEQAIMDLLAEQGYLHVLGRAPDRAKYDLMIKDDLRAYLRVRYQEDGFTDVEIVSVINRLNRLDHLSDKIEKRFTALVKCLKTVFDICSGSESITQDDRDRMHFYLAVRFIVSKLTKCNAPDTKQMNARVREMIGEALKSDSVEEIFDDEYLASNEKIKVPPHRFKLVQQLLVRAIEYIETTSKIKVMDLSQRDDTKSELKVDLTLVLEQHAYPPVDRNEVYKEIFQKVENF